MATKVVGANRIPEQAELILSVFARQRALHRVTDKMTGIRACDTSIRVQVCLTACTGKAKIGPQWVSGRQPLAQAFKNLRRTWTRLVRENICMCTGLLHSTNSDYLSKHYELGY